MGEAQYNQNQTIIVITKDVEQQDKRNVHPAQP